MSFLAELYGGSENFKPLKFIHHFVSGLKAYLTHTIHNTLTVLRESCGGAGMSAYSGLPYICAEYGAYVAFEGDNTVMVQQCSKYIIDGVLKNK
jgi:hypothetical protein